MPRIFATAVQCLMLLTAAFAPNAGCSNEPGAAKLTLECPERIRAGASLPVTVALQVGDAPICLWKGRHYNMELSRINSDQVERSGWSRPTASCGTHVLALLPLMPFIVVGGWMDIADLGGRFEVAAANGTVTDNVTLRFQLPDVMTSDGGFILPEGTSPTQFDPWPTGRFRMKARLRNLSDQSIASPPPLFWKPYDHPLEATATIEIVP